MARLIDADALIVDMQNNVFQHTTYGISKTQIDSAPTIDIVRCKECVDFVYDEQYKCYGCANDNGLMGEIKPDDFCSYGERREP